MISQTGMPRRPRLRAISRLPCAPPRMRAPFARNGSGLRRHCSLRWRQIGRGGVEYASTAAPIARDGLRRRCRGARRGDRSRRERRAGDEAQQRSETFHRIGADEMQLRHARIRIRRRAAASRRRRRFVPEAAAKECRAAQIDPIAGAEQDVIERFRAVIEIEHDAIGERRALLRSFGRARMSRSQTAA